MSSWLLNLAAGKVREKEADTSDRLSKRMKLEIARRVWREAVGQWRTKDLGSAVLEWRIRVQASNAEQTRAQMEDTLRKEAEEEVKAERFRRAQRITAHMMVTFKTRETQNAIGCWRANYAEQRAARMDAEFAAELSQLKQGTRQQRMKAVLVRLSKASLKFTVSTMRRNFYDDMAANERQIV